MIPCPRCGSTVRKEFIIHGGRSVRIDCQRGHFVEFSVWYGVEQTDIQSPPIAAVVYQPAIQPAEPVYLDIGDL